MAQSTDSQDRSADQPPAVHPSGRPLPAVEPSEGGGSSRALGIAGFVVLLVVAAGAVVIAVRSAGTGPAGPAGPSVADGASKAATAEAVDAVLNSASQYINAGDSGKAEAVLKSAIEQFVEEPRLYAMYGELLTSQKRLEEAYAQYVRAIALAPKDGAVEFAAGTVASMTGKLDRAVEHYSAAQSANPTDWKAPLFLAQVQIKLEQFDEAKKNLLLAARLRPEAATAWGSLADIALRENKPTLALQHIAKARELEPRVLMWRLIEARALKRDNRPEEALQVMLAVDPVQRREPGVMPLMAECYGMLNRPADAADMYAAAADADAARGDWNFEAALWAERAGRMEAAIKYARHAQMLAHPGAAELVARLEGK